MNIELMEKVQESILDETKRFDMGNWKFCIYGHMRQVSGAAVGNIDFGPSCKEVRDVLGKFGIDDLDRKIFYTLGLFGLYDRQAAVARIQKLIDGELPKQPVSEVPEEELVLV